MSNNNSINLSTPVSSLYLVGPTYAKRLNKLGVKTVEDLIYHFPFRYDDFSLISKIALLQEGEKVTISGIVKSFKNIYTKYGKKIEQAKIIDDTGEIDAIWFNQPFLVKNIIIDSKINLSGKIESFNNKLVISSPEYEIIPENRVNATLGNLHTGRLVPIYPETYGITSKWLRSKIASLLPGIKSELHDFLPDYIKAKYNLISLSSALFAIHFPDSKKDKEKAVERLSFDELFLLQLGSLKRKKEWERETVGNKFRIVEYKKAIQNFWEKLPFLLTGAQKRAVTEIFADLSKTKPMNRLLQGDVGSGKTVVAAIALYLSSLNGYQSALMAPTEILANQHYQTIKNLLSPLGLKIGLFTSATTRQQNSEQYDIYIGTHALLSEKLSFSKLGLVVIDEQHRFGVAQRAKLKEKGINPHLLTMTATPIPRTIALTLYNELDLSYLDEMPQGRQIIKTWVVPTEKRKGAYGWMEKQIMENNSQAFIVCPLIEESETLQSVKSAKKEFDYLSKEVFPHLKLGLLHGRLKSKEKDEVMQKFRNNEINILVSTPVVEVGIDIPNAAIIIIEAAERFGLAGIHQLRGRVGRNDKPSYCLLFTENNNPQVLNRLKSLERIHIGMELAELDLKLRGPGEIYGTKQHGQIYLKIASLSNLTLIEMAKSQSLDIISRDPKLESYPLLREKIKLLASSIIPPN